MAVPKPPLLIIGSHRSGTTMLVELLEEFGFFSGWKKDVHHESTFFIHLNEWILSQAGGSWIIPDPVKYFYESDLAGYLTFDFLVNMMRSPWRMEYLGWEKFWRYQSIFDLDFHWGWKTPPSTFTLPTWLKLFPRAKMIHILRHGIDVAASHKAFPDTLNNPNLIESNYQKKRQFYVLRGEKKGGFVANLRCSGFEGSFSLWEEYACEAQKRVLAMGHQALEIRYEDFLEQPVKHLEAVLQFASIEYDAEKVRNACGKINASRAFAYRKNRDLTLLAGQYRERLAKFGY